MKMILKAVLLAGLGVGLLVLIPDLALPITTAIDKLFQAEITNLLTAFYTIIPDQLMTLFVMQISTLAILILIGFFMGGKSNK